MTTINYKNNQGYKKQKRDGITSSPYRLYVYYKFINEQI